MERLYLRSSHAVRSMRGSDEVGGIHRHEHDFSSIIYLSIDEVGYALDISLEGGRFLLGCKVGLCGERRDIGLGCVWHNDIFVVCTRCTARRLSKHSHLERMVSEYNGSSVPTRRL